MDPSAVNFEEKKNKYEKENYTTYTRCTSHKIVCQVCFANSFRLKTERCQHQNVASSFLQKPLNAVCRTKEKRHASNEIVNVPEEKCICAK